MRGTIRQFFQIRNPLQRGYFKTVQEIFSYYLRKSISIRDTKEDDRKELFYRDVLTGVLRAKEDWFSVSDLENGDGYAGLLVKPGDGSLSSRIVIGEDC